MGIEVLGSAPSSPCRLPGGEPAPGLGECTVEAVARVLSGLLQRTVPANQVRDKAIAFGLLRQPRASGADPESPGGEGVTLTTQAASRLLLAAYHWPAQVAVGSLQELYRHLRAGHLVFVSLALAPSHPVLLQVRRFLREKVGPCWFFLTEPGAAPPEDRCLPRDPFLAAWAAGGNLLLVAARQWSDLPTGGPAFFGGSRSPDGTYHWDAAECDTDCDGRILRY